MAVSRKYAGLLPDLDEDQDLFETPELTDDASTRPPDSVGEDEGDTDTESVSGISRRRLDADSARSHFYTSKVDARRTDFSDRVDGKRQSYHVSSRRKGDEGFDEDASPREGLKRKIASLLREAEELKAEAQRQNEMETSEAPPADAETLEQLSSAVGILESLGPAGGRLGAEAHLAQQLSSATRPSNGDATPRTSAAAEKGRAPTYTLSYQPSFDDQHALSLAAGFDTRLKELEGALGLASIPLPTQNETEPKPLLPTLAVLEKQVSLLSSTTPASLDAMSKRIRQLTDEAERLADKRRAAKQSYAEMRAAASDAGAAARPKSNGSGAGASLSTSAPPSLLDDAEMETRIGALYKTLPTIETLAPTLPLVLERLKSLRLLHADAADAATRIERTEAQGGELAEEIAMWRQGLEKMEATVAKAEETTKANMKTVEGWVRDLEERAKGLHVEK